MKKFLLFITILAGALSFTDCSDNNSSSSGGENSDREFMTMFRTDYNTNAGSDDAYACQVVTGYGLHETEKDDNAIHWYWYAVDGCKGYQIRVALQPYVSNGAAAWEEAYQEGNLVLDTIVGPEVTDLIMKDLQYSTEYRGSIRVLSKKDADGDYTHASNWFGHGDGKGWEDYKGITTEVRYEFPYIVYESQITKTSFRVNLTPKLSEFTDDENTEYKKNFSTVTDADGNEMYKMDYLTVEASGTNPDATVPAEWVKYTITDEDIANGYIDIDGLDQNSVYTVNVVDDDIEEEKCFWDAVYNTLSVRTDGDPGDPILIEHKIEAPQRSDYTSDDDYNTALTQYNAMVEYDACRIDTIIDNYNSNNTLAEGQVFYLEGGKNYVLFNNADLCKGMTLTTSPEDLAAGKGRAKVYMGGINYNEDGSPATMNFMFGRMPLSGELGSIYIKSLVFEEIDFDCPLALHYNPSTAAKGSGNYFINMYSTGMAVTLQSFILRNCSVQHAIRGFIRVQGSNRRTFENMLVEGCDFYNDGYYDNNGGGYNWVHEENKIAKANIFVNVVFQNNTFYDSPKGSFFTNNKKSQSWSSDIKYNITFNNNTLVNFNTRKSGNNIFNLHYIPGGSTITCENNLFILAKQDGDTRKMYFQGMDIRTVTGGDGSGKVTYNIRNNWSTNSNLTSGQIFTGQAFSASKNSAGKYPEWCTYGEDELDVHVADISNEDLMYSPNPPYTDATNMHSTGYIDGTTASAENQARGITQGVNLYFKNFDNDIVKNNVGASKWRTSK